MLTVIFEADEIGDAINDVSVPVGIFDDKIDEAQEEVFVVDLTLSEAINDQITISRRSSLCRINDDDGEYYLLLPQIFQVVAFSILNSLNKRGGYLV